MDTALELCHCGPPETSSSSMQMRLMKMDFKQDLMIMKKTKFAFTAANVLRLDRNFVPTVRERIVIRPLLSYIILVND